MEIESLDVINLERPDSRNSWKWHATIPLRGKPLSKPDFCS